MRSDLSVWEQHIYLSNSFIRKWVLCHPEWWRGREMVNSILQWGAVTEGDVCWRWLVLLKIYWLVLLQICLITEFMCEMELF